MTRFPKWIRATALTVPALLLAGLAIATATDADARAAPASYNIGGMYFFAYEMRTPGYIAVNVGVSDPGTQTENSVLTQTLGDLPPYGGFREAAERYLSENFGRCWITGDRYLWQGEIRFSFQCR